MIVDAIETLFTPLCVYNNTKNDEDAQTLKNFKEPAWNNPVVRILDEKGKDIGSRISKEWTVGALANGMVQVLEKQKTKIPAYLRLLQQEEQSRKSGISLAVFSMG